LSQASPSAPRGLAAPPVPPAGLTLVCADAAARRAASSYLGYLAPGLAHLGASLRVEIQVMDPRALPALEAGATARLTRDRYEIARLGSSLVYARAGQGSVRIDPDAAAVAIHATDRPERDPDLLTGLLSIAFQEIAARRGLFGLHAGAVARAGAGYLLPGSSGSGKSSLCATLVRAGFGYLSDDFVLLSAESGRVRCVPCFRTMTLDVAWATRFPELELLVDLPAQPDGKRTFDPDRCFPDARVGQMRPTALVFPSIAARPRSALRPISPGDAFRRILPQSRLSAAPGAAEAHVRALEALVRSAPAFALDHGEDFLRAPEATLRRVLEALDPAPAGAEAR
jgi:hypothetical protein